MHPTTQVHTPSVFSAIDSRTDKRFWISGYSAITIWVLASYSGIDPSFRHWIVKMDSVVTEQQTVQSLIHGKFEPMLA